MNKKGISGTTILVITAILIVVVITMGALARITEVGEGIDFKREVLSYQVHYLFPLVAYSPGILVNDFVSQYPNSEIGIYEGSTRVQVKSEDALAGNFSNYQRAARRAHHFPSGLNFEGGNLGNSFRLKNVGKQMTISSLEESREEKEDLECLFYLQEESKINFGDAKVLLYGRDSFGKEVVQDVWRLLGGESADSKIKIFNESKGDIEDGISDEIDLVLEVKKSGNKSEAKIVRPNFDNFKFACLLRDELGKLDPHQSFEDSLIVDSKVHIVLELEREEPGRIANSIRRAYR